MKRLAVAGVLAFAFFASSPAFALALENADKMPALLDAKFIAEIWKEVIRVTNEEAPVLKLDEKMVMPKITYAGAPPKGREKVMAEIDTMVDKYGKVDLEKSSFAVAVYSTAFFRHLPEWVSKGEPPKFFPEQAYGAIAHEFFHKTLSYQYVSGDYQHCAMVFRGTLEKVLQFIDERTVNGTKVTEAVMGHVRGQCEKDSGGRIIFPSAYPSR